MSAPASSSAGHAHVDNKFGLFIQIALLLAVITGVEIVIVLLPWPVWVIIAGLVVLSIVKFMYVIFYFMHLKWDKLFCTILFFIGLILAVGTVWALLLLFGGQDSLPIGQVVQLAHRWIG